MRFVLAISALVLSGIMLILGIGQATFLSGPREIVYSTDFDAPNGIAVIRAEQFAAVNGQKNLVVEGAGSFAAIGHSRDVDAWTAPFAHAGVEVDAEGKMLTLTEVPSDAEAAQAYLELFPEEEASEDGDQESTDTESSDTSTAPAADELVPPSPYGSDLWLEQRGSAPHEAEQTESTEPQSDDQAAGDGGSDETAQTVRLSVSLQEDQAVLVAVDETAGGTISIEWIQDRRTPWAGPLLAAGGLFALIGAVLYLLAVDHDRRGLGPRRGRRGPLLGIRNLFGGASRRTGEKSSKPASSKDTGNESGTQRSSRAFTALPALALGATLALTGCSPSYWPDLSSAEEAPEEANSVETAGLAPVPVKQVQIDRIVSDIAEVAGVADDSLDGSGLGSRFTDDALAERLANYKIRAAVSDYEVVVPRITDRALGYQLVQSTEEWPRTIFVVLESEGDGAAAATADDGEESDAAAPDATEEDAAQEASPSLALIMTQEHPYENFLVSRVIALRGGITMPEAAPAEEGTALLADDLKSLVMEPAAVGENYAAVLAGGTAVEQAEHFDLVGDSLVERSGAAWVAQSASAASAAGQGINYSVSAAQSDADIVSLSTGVGGALVATTVLETRVEEPDGGRWRPTVPKSLTALSGLEGQQEKLISVVSHQLLFFVPSATEGGEIQLLGYTSDLIEARNS